MIIVQNQKYPLSVQKESPFGKNRHMIEFNHQIKRIKNKDQKSGQEVDI